MMIFIRKISEIRDILLLSLRVAKQIISVKKKLKTIRLLTFPDLYNRICLIIFPFTVFVKRTRFPHKDQSC